MPGRFQRLSRPSDEAVGPLYQPQEGYAAYAFRWVVVSKIFLRRAIFFGNLFCFFLGILFVFFGRGCFFWIFLFFFEFFLFFWLLLASVGFWLLLAFGFCWLLASVGFWLLLAFGFCWLLASMGFLASIGGFY